MILIPLSLATKGLVREMRRRCDIRPESRASSQQSRGYNCRDLMTSPRVENLSGVKQARHRTDKPGCSRTMARVPDNGRSAVSRPWFHYERPSRVWGERGEGGGGERGSLYPWKFSFCNFTMQNCFIYLLPVLTFRIFSTQNYYMYVVLILIILKCQKVDVFIAVLP